MNDNKLTHLDAAGAAHMVDITDKTVTRREAIAVARVIMNGDVMAQLQQAAAKKGDVLATARIAGIMAAKRTSDLIPLCHPLALNKVTVDFELDSVNNEVRILTRCVVEGKTGVEMEALTAASVAALTIYDMCKAVDPAMTITDIGLHEKLGGKRGHWQRESEGSR
ncbi:cyclic pyranopterin monophosphate synthase MoaC [Aliidiomarina haloalkalitolerans]|uniref:Cyclic pyranopterin monophosphate synthase n=1 Tax=Aliidiomarina haloalkalitolerans TaxID=859059 RepID=A0A432VVW6_9GAMM|nr:cyclic pyranopterin monophosphate synthase MoaC [Aliidiomarina haloalkalitolerans]RUO20749.1 cyclic pyranopterin monophosphate synthase MoaC [Aliidiomarina haloalkalitolerans]